MNTRDAARLEARIDLGAVRSGEPARPITVRLVGSPLAQMFQATTTMRWLKVEQPESPDPSEGWVRITVDEAAIPAGHSDLQGSISVVNRIGEFEIPVAGRVAGYLWPSAKVMHVPATRWANNSKILALSAAGVVAAAATTLSPIIHASSFLGISYYAIRFGLLFERFLNPERISMPDIDIDFCTRGRGEVMG